MSVQKQFNVTLPSVDTAGNALVAGQITQLDFVVTDGSAPAVTYTYNVPAGTALGATLAVPFADVTPSFVPVAGQLYGADVFAVDANGNGTPSPAITWSQEAPPPVPAAPTGFGVS